MDLIPRLRSPLAGSLLPLSLLLALAAGCGGSGSDSGSETGVRPFLTVAWPERSREIAAPGSALSARIILDPEESGQPDIIFQASRKAEPAAYEEEARAGSLGKPGRYSLSVLFYSEAGGAGEIVATAGIQALMDESGAILKPDGTALGVVTYARRVEKVVVEPDQVLLIGASTLLKASATDGTGSLIAVTPGSLKWSLSAPSPALELEADGDAKGLASGLAQVKAVVDGVESEAVEVRVRSDKPILTKADLKALDFTVDGPRKRVIVVEEGASVLKTFALPGGAAGADIPLPGPALQAALSSDGSKLFVGLASGEVKVLNAETGAEEATAALEAGSRAGEILAIPGDPDGFVAALVDQATGKVARGIWAFDGGVKRADVGVGAHALAINAAGNRVYGYEQFNGTNPALHLFSLGAGGLSPIITVRSQMAGEENRIHLAGGFLVADGGEVMDVGNGERRRNLLLGSGAFVGNASPKGSLTVGVSANPHAVILFDPVTGQRKEELALEGDSEKVLQAASAPGGVLVWRTAAQVVVARDLP